MRRPPSWLRIGPFGIGVIAVAFWVGYSLLPWDAYRYREERLVGLSEAEVIRLLGEPYYDSRKDKYAGASGPGYSLYYYGAGWMSYGVHFNNDRVDRVVSRRK